MSKPVPVDFPSFPPEGTVEEISAILTARLAGIAEVLRREHVWLKSRVDLSRQIEDSDDGSYLIEQGVYTAEELAEKRLEDNLTLWRAQVDTHLTNIETASAYITQSADLIRSLFLVEATTSGGVQ